MKKINLKLFLTITSILVGIFSFVFISNTKVSAQNPPQNTIKVETTGYSVLSASSFVFGGYYSGNFDKKGFTTYFEFKKNDSNLDDSNNRKETIKIVRDTNVEEANDFYTSPELDLMSTYFFRAVGYLNEAPDQKFYGSTLQMRTGYIPMGLTYPFTTVGNNNVPVTMKFISANISVNNITENSADLEITVYNKDPMNLDLKVEYGENTFDFESDTISLNSSGKSIITLDNLKPKTTYKYRLFDTANKLTPTATQTFTTKDTTTVNNNNNNNNTNTNTTTSNSSNQQSGTTGLVKCTENCGFNDLLTLINDVVKFVFTDLVLPIAAIMFAYAGFELVTSGGSTEKKSKARSIFTNVAIGLIVAAAAFLIVQAILSIVGYTGTTFLK